MSARGWHLDRWATPDDLENLKANGVCRWTMRERGTVLEGLSPAEARLIECAPALLRAAQRVVACGGLSSAAVQKLYRAVKRAEGKKRA